MQNLELLTLKFSELCSIHNLVQNTVGLGGRWEYHTEKSEGRWSVRFCMVVQVDVAPPPPKKSIAHPSRNSTGGCKAIAPLLSL